MTTLTPAPSDLGTGSPALGPWFSDAGLTLAAPNPDLSVTVTLPADARWLPPAGGVVGYYIASSPRPAALAGLRRADGGPAFTDGRLVVLFRLLPDVAARLAAMLGRLPSPDGTSPGEGVATRPAPASFAFEVEATPSVSLLSNLIVPDLTGSEAERARAAGLRLEGGQLANERTGAAIHRRPGQADDPNQTLIANRTGSDLLGRLWAFDERGRPIDPGAVAAWWNHLATSVYQNLWAEEGAARTCGVAGRLTVALVNAHEGPPDGALLDRLQTSGLTGDGTVRAKEEGGTGAATLSFTDPPAADSGEPDGAPVPLMALLPHGTYGPNLSLWESAPLSRDFCRVALVDVESHLTGLRRVAPAGATEADQRRAADQNRPSTRVGVGRTRAPALLATLDAAADAAIGVLETATEPAHVVAGPLDRDWGGLSPLAGLPDVDPPDAAPEITATALTGGGTAVDGTVANQQALLSCAFDPALAGAWVRAWPQGLDPVSGRHTWLDGGGGVVRETGKVDIVVTLPDGAVDSPAPLGLNLMVVTGRGRRLYADLRFHRPAPVGGNPVALADTSGPVLICETGQIQTGPDVTDIPPGCTLVQLPPQPAPGGGSSQPPALVDRASIPPGAWRSDTLIRCLTTGDLVQLSPPAFKGAARGDAPDALAGTGATVRQHGRNLLGLGSRPGDPLPAMERLEVVAAGTTAPAGTGAADPFAAVGGGPALARYHELLPHAEGHPGAPAAAETHGTGVLLNGDAAVLVREYTRERTAGFTPELAVAAATPLSFPGGSGPSCWAAPLRTVAAGVEAEVNPTLLQALLGEDSTYPWGANAVAALRDWLDDYGISLPDDLAGAADSIARAIDRRMLVGSRGAREGLIALVAAIRRAEDLVYIETPALDGLPAGPAGDQVSWLQALKDRMAERPDLQVLICFPNLPLPGTPSPLNRVRAHMASQALQSLREGDRADRVAVFCPVAGPGRTLRLASTTVVVDDAWVMTGTTHLWRRGLTFGSSLAVALFDEQLTGGRPAEIVRFRRRLVADRLGLEPDALPARPADLVRLVRRQATSGGGGRIAAEGIRAPSPAPSDDERRAWNPDGSPDGSGNPVWWLTDVIANLLRDLVS